MSNSVEDLPFDMSGAWYHPLLGYMFIWHSCLELTITGPGRPMHHLVLDGEFLCDDYDNSGVPMQFTGKIEEPFPDEAAKGAKQVVVFSDPNGAETARRFIDADGNLHYFRINLNSDG